MHTLWTFLVAHQVLATLVAYWVFSAAVSSMPEPNGSKGYKWLYGFLHKIAGDLSAYVESKQTTSSLTITRTVASPSPGLTDPAPKP